MSISTEISDLFRASQVEIIHKNWKDIFHLNEEIRSELKLKQSKNSSSFDLQNIKLRSTEEHFKLCFQRMFVSEKDFQYLLSIYSKTDESIPKSDFLDMASNLPSIIWRISLHHDGSFNEVYCSEIADDILEIPRGTINNNIDKFFSYIQPESLDTVYTGIEQIIQKPETPIDIEYNVLTSSGKIKTLKASMKSMNKNGQIILYGHTSDITKAKTIENELQETRKKEIEKVKTYESFFRQSRDGYVINKGSGEILHTNQAFLDMMGYSLEECKKVSWRNFTPKKWLDWELETHGAKLVERGYTDIYEKEYIRKDGSVFPVQVQAFMINNSEKLEEALIAAITRDISKQKENESLLAKKTEELLLAKIDAELNFAQFKSAFETSAIGMCLVSLEGNFDQVNESLVNMLGYTEKELLAKSFQEITHPEDLNKDLDLIYKTIRGEIDTYQMEKRYFHKSGEIVYTILSVSLVRDNNGDPLYFVSQIQDISDRINMAIELEKQVKNYASLTDVYREQNKELQVSKEKAEESDRLKTIFLANMSHEIRTPINGIMGFTNLLKSLELSPEKQKQYVTVIENSGKRLLGIINDLIDISLIESGAVKLNRTYVNINQQLDSLYQFFLLDAQQKELEFELHKEVADEASIIFTDQEKFYAIMTNLLKNAMKYTHNGRVEFGNRIESGRMEIYVQDTGIGIAPERKEAIFDRFVQADLTTTKAYEGAGLGLSITKAYINLLNGDMRLHSQPGKGSKFQISLPIQKPVMNGSKHKNMDTKNKNIFSDLNVLITEDDEIAHFYLQELLSSKCKQLFHATAGDQAVEITKNNPVDLILMDIKLHNMDGYTATREIRKFNEDVLIIAQTAYAFAADKEEAFKAGCNAHLAKPLSEKDLVTIVESLVSQRRA